MMEKIDKFYEKIHGSYFGIIGLSINVICMTISIGLVLLIDPMFSFFTYYISDLGTVRNGAHIVFSTGMMLTSIFFFLFLLFLTRCFQKKSEGEKFLKISYIFVFLVLVGLFFVGFIAYDVNPLAHRFIGTVPFFIGIIMLSVIFTKLELSFQEFPKIIIVIGVALTFSSIVFLIFVISFTIVPELRVFPLSSFSQWIFFFTVILWVLAHTLYTLKQK
ncbi:MAG: DUF998 domain-containing protein [Candidatus Lokiarchaeota archaeon]|nr:DUF998 domain-containing protein [Candidatus Lokiarchaeota archaeon]MBD3343231.1 DUF998 domain-containing protein [Candidatus Lokiarchaeota archaeon]